jgi:hypothetical protein
LLGSLDAAVNTDVIVLEWELPKISGIDLLVKQRRQFVRIATVFSRRAQRSAGTQVDSQRRPP